MGLFNWLYTWAGLSNGTGPIYLGLSGIIGDLALLSVVGVVFHRLNCHQTKCWRIGVHRVEGTPFITCRRHHPLLTTGPITAEHIHRAHHEHRRRQQNQQSPT